MLKIIKENIRNVEFLVNKMYGVTHMGKFHADEVFASVILELYFGTLYVIRSQDKDILRSYPLM